MVARRVVCDLVRPFGSVQCLLPVFLQVATVSWVPFFVDWPGSVKHSFPLCDSSTYSPLESARPADTTGRSIRRF